MGVHPFGFVAGCPFVPSPSDQGGVGAGRGYEEAIAQNAVLQRQLAEAREEIASVRSANASAPHNFFKLLNRFVEEAFWC